MLLSRGRVRASRVRQQEGVAAPAVLAGAPTSPCRPASSELHQQADHAGPLEPPFLRLSISLPTFLSPSRSISPSSLTRRNSRGGPKSPPWTSSLDLDAFGNRMDAPGSGPIWFVPPPRPDLTLAVPVQNPPDPAMVAAPWSLLVQAVARPQPRPDLEALALTWCVAVSPWTELHHQARPDLKPCTNLQLRTPKTDNEKGTSARTLVHKSMV
ncbi:hypothetical protein ZWY2020_054658 [Hordeum vulgare]|nr:hypothetical protein ZWY2020_054658 [Hordeum vulgare]